MSPIEPPRWTDEQLEADRLASITRFRKERLQEPLEQYLETFDSYRGVVEELLEATVDLARLSPPDVELLTDPALLEAIRYLSGPPISKDDLEVLADGSLSAKKLREDPDMADRVVRTILVTLDRRRFPWVAEGREPEESEREAAALASAALLAASRLGTDRRNTGKEEQEHAVAEALSNDGFTEVAARTIQTLDDAPKRGEFCAESPFGGRKADFVVGLWDGRKMPIECKVSNSSTNSIKRLNNDAAVKAKTWLEVFGTAQTVPAAVIGGVFKLRNLKDAQRSGLTIFWAIKLDAMLNWIESTRSA